MKCVTSKVKLNMPKIRQLDKATTKSLEMTVDALRTEVVMAQVMPFGDSYDRGGKHHRGGTMQNTSTFPDYDQSHKGIVKLVTSTPYARRMYFHPEYNFRKIDNPNARGNWYEPWISGKHKNFCSKAFSQFYKKEAGL